MTESKILKLSIVIPHPNGVGTAQILDRETGKDLALACTGLKLDVSDERVRLNLEIMDFEARLYGEFVGTMDLKPMTLGEPTYLRSEVGPTVG